jgi:uncharacterized RDD family membrane protein YckC
MNDNPKIKSGNRIFSMFLDHIAMTTVAMIFALPMMASVFKQSFIAGVTHEPQSLIFFNDLIYVALIGYALYFCKDCIQGRSIGKRALKFQVVNKTTEMPASPIRTFIRNLFIIFWPLEVLVVLVYPEQRIGDMVAGTKVIPFKPEFKQTKIKWGQFGICLVLAYGLMLLMFMPFQNFFEEMENTNTTYVESSLNKVSIKETEQLYVDSLGDYLVPDVVVYDEINEDEELKYVSVILRLKENYLENDESAEQLQSEAFQLLLYKFPIGSFVGQIKLVYRDAGSMKIKTVPIDWRDTE